MYDSDYINTNSFENIGDATDPSFATAQTNLFGLTDVGDNGVPTFADIDGDGDLDAFVGNFDRTYAMTLYIV